MYKECAKLKLRFPTIVGALSVEQLWDLGTNDLNILVVNLEEQYEESKGKSYLRVKTKKDKTLKLMFDVALDVLNTRLDEQEEAASVAEIKKEEQRILGLIQNKKQEGEKELSIEELETKLKALKKK